MGHKQVQQFFLDRGSVSTCVPPFLPIYLFHCYSVCLWPVCFQFYLSVWLAPDLGIVSMEAKEVWLRGSLAWSPIPLEYGIHKTEENSALGSVFLRWEGRWGEGGEAAPLSVFLFDRLFIHPSIYHSSCPSVCLVSSPRVLSRQKRDLPYSSARRRRLHTFN